MAVNIIRYKDWLIIIYTFNKQVIYNLLYAGFRLSPLLKHVLSKFFYMNIVYLSILTLTIGVPSKNVSGGQLYIQGVPENMRHAEFFT